MKVKIKVRFPEGDKTARKTVEIEVRDKMAQDEVITWAMKNKRKILKEAGCELNNGELTRAINLGEATVAPIV